MADPSKKDHAQTFFDGIVNVMNDIRHKLVEEPWFGWGNGRTVTDDIPERAVKDTSPQHVMKQSAHAHEPTTASTREPDNYLASHEVNRPTEDGSWWQGEYDGSYGGSNDKHRNGWELGQDSFASREGQVTREITTPPALDPKEDWRDRFRDNADVYGHKPQTEHETTKPEYDWRGALLHDYDDVYGHDLEQEPQHEIDR